MKSTDSLSTKECIVLAFHNLEAKGYKVSFSKEKWYSPHIVSKYVYFEFGEQDSCFDENGNLKPDEFINLAWDGDGYEIMAALSETGLNVSWDGSAFTCIVLDA